MKLYQKLEPNYNDDFPNIFNTIQSKVYSLDRKINVGGEEKILEAIDPWTLRLDN